MSDRSILIMAGGTGGHVYPALAVAEYLREQGIQPFWLGTRGGLEARVVAETGIPLTFIRISGLRGTGIVRWLSAPVNMLIALAQSLGVILKRKPSVVIGLGGFVSGPGGIAAWLLRKPLFIHEQNAIPGLTNRLLAPFARTVMQGFPGTLQGNRVVTTGNPVRKDIMRVSAPEERMMGRDQQPLRLLVLGGSLGAKVFNDIMPELLIAMPATTRIEVWHQTGIKHFEVTRVRYEDRGITTARLMPFIDDMADAYAWADIVLCRAGALTVSELCIAGVASILVPFPYAADDHQTANARYLVDSGGAVLLSQQELTVTRITSLLSEFDRDRIRLTRMAVAARKQAYPDATADIAAICMEVING